MMAPSTSSACPPVGYFDRTTCSMTPIANEAQNAMGRLCNRPITAPASPASSSDGPSASTGTVPWVG